VQVILLQVLLLGYNRIARLETDWFRPLVDLKWLSLAGNRLSALKPGQFRRDDLLPQLGHFDLSRNRIEKVGDDALSGLGRLRDLDLSRNLVGRLSPRSFAGLADLRHLDLSANRLDDVPTEALKVFENLDSLTLDANPLPSLPSRRLTGFAARRVSVSRAARLRFVDAEAFFDVARLTTLALHDNPTLEYVSECPVGPRTRAAGVVDVLLHGNRLTAIGNLSGTLTALQQLTLYGNPLRCDCHSDWIQQTVIRRSTISRNSL